MSNSNIELLRIVNMVLIAMFHFSVHGTWPEGGPLASDTAVEMPSFGGKIGVNCFMLITGCFAATRNETRWDRLPNQSSRQAAIYGTTQSAKVCPRACFLPSHSDSLFRLLHQKAASAQLSYPKIPYSASSAMPQPTY